MEHRGEGLYHALPLLRRTAIRLLHIHQSHDSNSIHCSLEVADLANKPDYRALSYTWGPPTDHAEQRGMTNRRCCPIVCNEETILVTENLYNFLRLFAQDPTNYTLPRPWWIDALCIDQDNVLERNEQVLKIRDIYSAAFSVVVWLGNPDEYTLPALKLLSKLGSIAQEEDGPENLLRNDPLAPDDFRDGEAFDFTIEPSDWRALKELYARRWFARVWIVQEFAVAKATIFLCGNHLIEEEKLLFVANHIGKSSWVDRIEFGIPVKLNAPVSGGTILVVAYAAVALNRMHFLSGGYETLLQYAIYVCRGRRSTDPRDQIYALLGFHEGSTGETQSHKPIVPDYTKSVTQVYIEATHFMLYDSSDLSTLSAVEDRAFRLLKSLPSWVPDYSIPFVTGIGYRRMRLYSASRTLKPDWQIIENSTVLSSKALRIDTVSRVGTNLEDKDIEIKSWWSHDMLSIVADMDEYYVNGQGRVEALWRTLIGDSQSQCVEESGFQARCPAPHSLGKSFHKWILLTAAICLSEVCRKYLTMVASEDPAEMYKAMRTTLDKLSTDDTSDLVPCADDVFRMVAELLHEGSVDRDLVSAALPYKNSIYENRYMRFFRTAKGLMGMGPRSLERGDSVWLFPGAEVFFVLRDRHGTKRFEFMGDAYVHGLMHGKALDNADQDFTTVELE